LSILERGHEAPAGNLRSCSHPDFTTSCANAQRLVRAGASREVREGCRRHLVRLQWVMLLSDVIVASANCKASGRDATVQRVAGVPQAVYLAR